MAREFGADLRDVIEKPGPFVSLYLNTEAAREEGPDEIALRWRGLRDTAVEAGATEPMLEVVDSIVADSHRKGNGLAVIASDEGILLRRHLSRPVADDVAVGPVPRLLPLVEWTQENPRYVVALVDREGGEIHVVSGHTIEDTETVEGDTDPIQKVHAGGWSMRRFQNRAENNWEANAKAVADELGKMVSAEEVDFVVLAGDVRAVQFLEENAPQEVDAITFGLGSSPATGIEDIQEELDKAAAAFVGRTVEELLEKFQEERGQNDLACEGKEEIFAALAKAQVETLLIARGRVDDPAFFSKRDLTQAGLDRRALAELGLSDLDEAPAEDVLVRTALGTGSRVVVIPDLSKVHGPREGVGGLLRYAL
ncbi:MAG TPA: Vms1/Ankzf1 family peptidyl-tRNA hydrolase [Actinomycetota bacterium]|nr:Vms1/Ankzf1 family peptidyl-tRNA hydrolase [Actinomycetota bacterium]